MVNHDDSNFPAVPSCCLGVLTIHWIWFNLYCTFPAPRKSGSQARFGKNDLFLRLYLNNLITYLLFGTSNHIASITVTDAILVMNSKKVIQFSFLDYQWSLSIFEVIWKVCVLLSRVDQKLHVLGLSAMSIRSIRQFKPHPITVRFFQGSLLRSDSFGFWSGTAWILRSSSPWSEEELMKC